jgi:glycogen debranching enzyme
MATPTNQFVLKEGNVFLISQENGDISGNTALGLYYSDMRYLSLLEFKINGESPALLNFSGYRNFMGTLQFTNELFQLPDGTAVLPESISIRRSCFISEGLHERLGCANYNRFPVPVTITLTFGADFRDLFDVRGFSRDKWGELLPPLWENDELALRYMGLDGLARSSVITFDRAPDEMKIHMPASTAPIIEPSKMVPIVGLPSFHITIEPPTATAHWNLILPPNSPASISFHVMPDGLRSAADEIKTGARNNPSPASTSFRTPPTSTLDGTFDKAVNYMRLNYWNWEKQSTDIFTDNEDFNHIFRRSKFDLRVLSDLVREGYFPAAGIPWYACPFGRDSLITSLQTLAFNPLIAMGTLYTLARYQGTREDPWREEQPGKILHELRNGEMARLGLVPHTPYYGTVDATPLFVCLFVETMRWLDNDNLYKGLLPNVMKALEWIDKYGDIDGDGFVEYKASTSSGGIRNQVWKDSYDSIQYSDGTLAETPIAAVEVQAYVYAAKKGVSELLRRKGDGATAERLEAEANELRKRFNETFWMPELGFFTQGLDKDKQQVETISSNPGHCLWCGIVDEEKARLTVERLMRPDMVSGWGIRTISHDSPSYNPMSYHNGSIWPHDNSLIVAGFKRYGYNDEANTIITQIAEAAQYFRYYRLPELYCGFTRDTVYNAGPSEYPVSCSPQAWAAAAPMLMMQSILGLQADAVAGQVRVSPNLPDWLSSVQVSNLLIGERRVDIVVEKHNGRNEVSLSSPDAKTTLIIG